MPHRALECVDILEEIFQHCSPAETEPCRDIIDPNRKALASAARVCRAFTEPALNVLWETLDNLLPALRLLPSFSSTRVRIRPENVRGAREDKYALDSARILPADWTHFQLFARRVRTLTYKGAYSLQAQRPVMEQLYQHNDGQPLFPLLTSLTCILSSPYDKSVLTLTSPSLHHIVLRMRFSMDREEGKFQEKEQALGHLLEAICSPSRTPLLQGTVTSGIYHLLSLVAICSRQTLSRISMDPYSLSNALCQGLAILPNLVDLEIDTVKMSEDITDCVGFAKLEKLVISSNSYFISQFLSIILSRSIHKLSVLLRRCISFDHFEALLFNITSKWPSLRVLRLQVWDYVMDDVPLSQALQPLTSLHSLEVIDLTFAEPMTILSQGLLDMASAWPDVEEFSIHWHTSAGFVTVVPIDAAYVLTTLARLCPKLKMLDLPHLDFRTLPAPDTISHTSHLRTLKLGYNSHDKLADPAAIAHFLDMVCPELDVQQAIAEEYYLILAARAITPYRWKKVLEGILALRQERAHGP